MIHKIMRQVYVMNVYSVFFLELYNKHKESYRWIWSIYTSCIRQFRKSVNKEKYNYLRVLLLFLKEEFFFFFFNLRKQTLKAELKQLIEAIQ